MVRRQEAPPPPSPPPLPTSLHVLVTGGSGFLGGAIVRQLLSLHPDWHISVLDVHPPPPSIATRLAHFFPVDITSAESVNDVFADYTPDVVLHTAGIIPARRDRYSTDEAQWQKVRAINYTGTRHVLDAAMTAGCRRFVYTSSCTVIIDDLDHDYHAMDETIPLGHATLHYGKSKALAETYVLAPEHASRGLLACALRPATIIGPGDRAVLPLLHDLIAKGETHFIVGDGDNFYDWLYISNAVDAHLLALHNLLTTRTAAGHAFFISNQQPVYFWDSLAYVWSQFGHYPRFRVRIPGRVAWVAGLVAEWWTWVTGSAATLDRGSVRDGIRTHYADGRKAREVLGYVPRVGLVEGWKWACEDYKKFLEGEGKGNGVVDGEDVVNANGKEKIR